MAYINIQDYAGPRYDRLGLSLFIFHIGVGCFVLAGWLIASFAALVFYLVLLPGIAVQWWFNRGCCVLNNLESWLRSGRWRDPMNREEGAFLAMLFDWLFGARPSRAALDRLSYTVVLLLWLLGLGHLWLTSA
jgi:hypothetical protein